VFIGARTRAVERADSGARHPYQLAGGFHLHFCEDFARKELEFLSQKEDDYEN